MDNAWRPSEQEIRWAPETFWALQRTGEKNILPESGIKHIYLTVRNSVTVLTELSHILFLKHTNCIRSRSQLAIVLKLPTSINEIKKKK
jgi:hypothetical protein